VVESVSDTAGWWPRGRPAVPMRWVGRRDPPGQFQPPARRCTELPVKPAQIIQWCGWRWLGAVTLEAVRAHRGVEPLRPWSEQALVRRTPALLALFARLTLLAREGARRGRWALRQTAG
jgi:hypothetical protein